MSAREKIQLFALIGDLKEVIYAQALLISALQELLQAREIFTPQELEATLRRLQDEDRAALLHSTALRQDA